MSVAPFAGAWIETSATAHSVASNRSRPSRARGSKHPGVDPGNCDLGSRPSRARGSKPRRPSPCRRSPAVAPFAGAWIETESGLKKLSQRRSRPSRARGSKHPRRRLLDDGPRSRPSRARGSKHPEHACRLWAGRRALRGRVDRNRDALETLAEAKGRALRGRVDRNFFGIACL